MKKILLSLGTIALVAAAAIGVTTALFSDTETSANNIFTAGSIDLKVDHTRQSYNGVDCKTCDITIVSDESNYVVEKDANAVFVSNPHQAWTASITGVEWIWATDPTTPDDEINDVVYTFRKTFEWWGPINGAVLIMDVGADNGYEITLNGNPVGSDSSEHNYNAAGQDLYSGTLISDHILQGTNVLEIKVHNHARPAGATWDNPGGLLYQFVIDGECEGDYFKTHCTLFGEKDLGQGDYFWQFDDIKPGDYGRNVISVHVDSNDAFICLLNNDLIDEENNLTEVELSLSDDAVVGELSKYLKIFVWDDNNNGIYEPPTEANLYEGSFDLDGLPRFPLVSGSTDFLGMAWCIGTQTVNHTTGEISCSGAGDQNDAQTDEILAALTVYAVQQRNNPDFTCDGVVLPTPEPIPTPD